MDAEELNLMVPLVCDNPQWKHIKFSFEDSREEVTKYYHSKEVGILTISMIG